MQNTPSFGDLGRALLQSRIWLEEPWLIFSPYSLGWELLFQTDLMLRWAAFGLVS